MPFDDFSWGQFNYNYQIPHDMGHHYADDVYLPHQMPAHYVDDMHSTHQRAEHYEDMRFLPHQIPEHYDDMRFSPHRILEHYDDTRFSPHRIPEHYDDMRFSPHRIQEHYDDMSFSPHQISEHYDDLRFLPHRIPEHYDDMRFIPHQTPAYYDDKRHLTHQRPEHYADKRPLPHQTAKDFSAKRNLSHHRPKNYADKRHLPLPLWECDADNRPAPRQTLEDFPDKRILPQQKPKHCADKRHIRQKMPENFADKRILPHQKTEDIADKRDLQHQKLEDTCSGLDAIARAPRQGPMTSQSDLRTKVEEGKVHREVQNCGTEECAEKVCSPHQKQKPTVPVVATVERVQCEICNIMVSLKSLEEHYNGKRHRRMLHDQSTKQKTSNGEESRHIQNSQMNPVVQTPDLPHQTPENYADKKCLPHQTPEPTIPAELVHCETSDVISPVKCLEEHNGGKKHRRMLSKPCGQSMKDGSPVENISHEAPRFRYKEVPAEGSKRKVRDKTDVKGNVFKCKVEEATGGKYMKMNNGIKRLVKSSKLEVNDLSNSAESLVQIAELTPSSGHVASPKLAPIPDEGSSFELASQHVSPSLSQESKDKEVPVTSAVFTPADAAAGGLSLEPSIHIDSQTELAEGNEHHEVQNYGMETNDQPALPDALGPNFEPLTEHGLHTEIEPEVSEPVVYYESQNPFEETNIELPQSDSMEIDADSEVRTETKTADGSLQVEEEMDVLFDESGKVHLPQVFLNSRFPVLCFFRKMCFFLGVIHLL